MSVVESCQQTQGLGIGGEVLSDPDSAALPASEVNTETPWTIGKGKCERGLLNS